MYIKSALNDEEIDISKLNFTFNITSFENNNINIKLDFNYPFDISPFVDLDEIVYHSVDHETNIKKYFIS